MLIVIIIYPQWRNWLARSAVNRKAIGSSPIWGVFIISICHIKFTTET
jgi:hypothetical protein